MGTKYEAPTLSGFNSSPPTDDGQQIASNEIEWAKHINKIGNPLRTFAEAIQSRVEAHLDEDAGAANTANFTISAGNFNQVVTAGHTGTATINASLPDANTSPYSAYFRCIIWNRSLSANLIINLVDATDSINGVTNGTITLLPLQQVQVFSGTGAGAGNWFVTPLNAAIGPPKSEWPTIERVDNNTVRFKAGKILDRTGTVVMNLENDLDKDIDASWVEGAGGGAVPGELPRQASETLHCFIIGKTDGTADAGFQSGFIANGALGASLISTAQVSGYTQIYRIGTIVLRPAIQVRQFHQIGDWFWTEQDTALVTSHTITTGVTNSLVVPEYPLQIPGNALIDVSKDNGTQLLRFTNINDATTTNPAATAAPKSSMGDPTNSDNSAERIMVGPVLDLAGTMRIRAFASATHDIDMALAAWYDDRSTQS